MAKTKEKTREKILQSALKLFNSKGGVRITTNHIIADLSISPGTLYYYFHNKEEIIRAHFCDIGEKFYKIFSQKNVYSLEIFIQDLEKIYNIYYEYRYFYLNIIPLLNKDPLLAKAYRENYIEKKKIIESYICGFIENGVIRKDMNQFLGESPYKELFQESMWIITDYWLSFHHASKDKLTKKDIHKGISQILLLLKPWLNEKAAMELDSYLKIHLKKYNPQVGSVI